MVFNLPIHQVLQEWQQFLCHFLMLQLARMPTGTISQVTFLEREVEAINLLISLLLRLLYLASFIHYRLVRQGKTALVGFCADSVKCSSLLTTLLLPEHRTCQEHNLGIRIFASHGSKEHAVILLIKLNIIIIRRKIIGT